MKRQKSHLWNLMGLLLALAVLLAGCGQETAANTVKPYPITEEQQELLQYLNLNNTANLFSYQCPENSQEVTITSYVLEDGTWVINGQGTLSWDGKTVESREGVFTLIYQEDRRFAMSLHAQGTSSFRSDPVDIPPDLTASSNAWLSEEVEIQLEKEIPVALFVSDSGNRMSSLTVEDYFSPEKLEEMDLVQAVTMTFV
ncbi:MAG: hypothetical protein ACOYJZ_06775 [Acutalibacter sp.]